MFDCGFTDRFSSDVSQFKTEGHHKDISDACFVCHFCYPQLAVFFFFSIFHFESLPKKWFSPPTPDGEMFSKTGNIPRPRTLYQKQGPQHIRPFCFLRWKTNVVHSCSVSCVSDLRSLKPKGMWAIWRYRAWWRHYTANVLYRGRVIGLHVHHRPENLFTMCLNESSGNNCSFISLSIV